MSELRENPFIFGERVIIAPERGRRPSDFEHIKINYKITNSDCPFCPGNEHMTTKEILHYGFPGEEKKDWHVRIVTNKFPALISNEPLKNETKDKLFKKTTGYGIHEVIITRHHSFDLGNPELDKDYNLTREVMWAYNKRKQEIKKKYPKLKYINLFKNRGSQAGASIEHSHLQIIGNEHIPIRPFEELETAKEFYKKNKKCLYCEYIKKELEFKDRIIEEYDGFISFVPYAPRFPYEVWIAPKEHLSDYYFDEKNISDCESATFFSEILRRTFNRLNNVLGYPSYNMWLHDSPVNKKTNYYHWHIEIVPKLTSPGGFEKGTGEYINPVLPEQVARELREAEF